MKKSFTVTAALALAMLAGSGCSSLRIVQGQAAPPNWVANPSALPDADTNAFVFASGISTYNMVLEEGINDARHDAIRKIAERVSVTADDIYRTDRNDKLSNTHTDMPNTPQTFFNSHKAVSTGSKVETKKTRNPQANHVSQTRLHGMDEFKLSYTVWQYGPSLWAKMIYGDTAVRFYDVYVLMRCPKTEFTRALRLESEQEGILPAGEVSPTEGTRQ